MNLETITKKVRACGKKLLIGGLLTVSLALAECEIIPEDPVPVVPDPIVIDTAHTGMITGKVTIPQIGNNNQIIYEGVEEVGVIVEETDFKTASITNGIYSIDNIPTGSYNVKANVAIGNWGAGILMEYSSEIQPTTVIKQQNIIVNDHILIPLSINNQQILYGKIYQQNKLNPLSYATINLHRPINDPIWPSPGRVLETTTSSTDGSYAFYVSSSRYILTGNGEILKILDSTDSTLVNLWSESGLIQKDLYVASE